MGWATPYIEALWSGRSVQFRPVGRSMSGRIESGQLCFVEPIAPDAEIAVDWIVLCTVGRSQYLHLVKDVRKGQFLIGNNRGGLNGWVGRESIHGRCTRIDP